MAVTENSVFRAEQWDALYHKISETLRRFAKISPAEEADLWLIDDDYGGHHHKIEVVDAQAWSEEVQKSVGEVLAEFHPGWGVYVVFDDGSDKDGFIVYADGVETAPRTFVR